MNLSDEQKKELLNLYQEMIDEGYNVGYVFSRTLEIIDVYDEFLKYRNDNIW